MEKEIYSLALKNALTEIRGISEGVVCSFVFSRDGELIAGDDGKPEKTLEKACLSVGSVFEKTNIVGDVKSLEIQSENGKILISSVNDVYLATVMTKKADVKYVETVARVIVPTLLRVLENVSSAPLKNNKKSNSSVMKEKVVVEEVSENLLEQSSVIPLEKPAPPERFFEVPAVQLLVDTMKGLLVRSDTVQIDAEMLAEWSELCESGNISEVEIETFDGKTVACKVKPINDSKLLGSGLIRVPEKLCQMLEVRKGELVKVKPVLPNVKEEN